MNYISVYNTNFSYSKNWTYPTLPPSNEILYPMVSNNWIYYTTAQNVYQNEPPACLAPRFLEKSLNVPFLAL